MATKAQLQRDLDVITRLARMYLKERVKDGKPIPAWARSWWARHRGGVENRTIRFEIVGAERPD